MSKNGNKTVKTLAPEPTTPATTNKEIGNTRKGIRKGNFRGENEEGAIWLEQKYFKRETPELNASLGCITKILDQGVTFDRFQDVLNNYFLKNFRKQRT